MVSVATGGSAEDAARYFREHLTRDDYYSQQESVRGEWFGQGAARLGLAGDIAQEDFVALIGNDLKQFGQEGRPRRSKNCLYDFTFTAPKSVSILSLHDDRVRDVYLAAVKKAVTHAENLAQARDRRGLLYSSETVHQTGNLAAGLFVHEASRTNDPNLHVHAVLANLTYHADRKRWLALQAVEIYRQRRLIDKIAAAEAAHGLRELGYEIRKTEHSFEICGFDQALIDHFSRRRRQVKELTADLRQNPAHLAFLAGKYGIGAKKPLASLTDAEIRQLATLETRPEKVSRTRAELIGMMNDRLSPAQAAAIDAVRTSAARGNSRAEDATTQNSQETIRHALDHELERASAVWEPKLLETALQHGLGNIRFDQLNEALASGGGEVFKANGDNGRTYITTWKVLDEEASMIDFVRRTRGTCRELNNDKVYRPFNAELSEEQCLAVDHVRRSRDRVIAIRGKAGTGKTWMTQEALRAIHAKGHDVYLFAPSSEASRGVIRAEAAAVRGDRPEDDKVRLALSRAETVEQLLCNPALQAATAGQVIWIDEAGLLSSPTMTKVLSLADKLDCRVVLAGDTGQHAPVERGDSLRILEKRAGLKPAELGTIRRQRNATYRAAVEAFAHGDVERGCQALASMEAWREIPDGSKRYRQLAADYVDHLQAGKEVLAVSPTHAEGLVVTAAIRSELRSAGLLRGKDTEFVRLVNSQFTRAQKSDSGSFRPGQIIQFVRRTPGFDVGERITVDSTAASGRIKIQRANGQVETVALPPASTFSVYSTSTLSFASGDSIRITQNGLCSKQKIDGPILGGERVNNGTLLKIRGFSADGDIECTNGLILPKDYGHFNAGYCLTSHAAQGKTVDHVLVAENAQSAVAVGSREQGYVSLSRGRASVRIYTDSRASVEAEWWNSSQRIAASDLATKPLRSLRATRLRHKIANLISSVGRRAAEALGHKRRAKHEIPQPSPSFR